MAKRGHNQTGNTTVFLYFLELSSDNTFFFLHLSTGIAIELLWKLSLYFENHVPISGGYGNVVVSPVLFAISSASGIPQCGGIHIIFNFIRLSIIDCIIDLTL